MSLATLYFTKLLTLLRYDILNKHDLFGFCGRIQGREQLFHFKLVDSEILWKEYNIITIKTVTDKDTIVDTI
jgi:hypothetical protein